MAVTDFASIDDLADAPAGMSLGCSGWRVVEQRMVDLFADATDDRQWIHVDPVRALAGPFGGPIAHGYLTLSLAVPLMSEIVSVGGSSMGINYGTNKVRFPSPVAVGSSVRGCATLAEVSSFAEGVQAAIDLVIEIEKGAKPACAAQVIYRFYR